jgi:hypothetical protein
MKESAIVDSINIDFSRFSRYCDTMVGNGKSILEFWPKGPCLLNDSNTDITNFYKNIHDPELIKKLKGFLENWKLIEKFSSISSDEIIMSYNDFDSGIISSEDLSFMLRAIIMMNMDNEEFNQLFEKNFVISIDMLINTLIKQIESSLITLKTQNQKIEQCNFILYLEHTFKSGFYEHFKTLMNLQKTELIDCLTLNTHLTLWFYLKEFGKGKHLNYDSNGNIKNSYDKKSNIQDSVLLLSSFEDVKFTTTLKNATISNISLSSFIQEITPNKEDILVANLEANNVVLSTGKNHSTLQNKLDLIKPLLIDTTNVLISIDTEKEAHEIMMQCSEKFQLIKSNTKYYIINFSID